MSIVIKNGKKVGNKKKRKDFVPLLWAKGVKAKQDPRSRAPREISVCGKQSNLSSRRDQRAFKRLPANRREPKEALG